MVDLGCSMWDESRYIHPRGGEAKKLVSRSNAWIHQTGICMHAKPCEVKCGTTVPGQHSNDRLTVPAKNGTARNSVLQSHCPEYGEEKHAVHIDGQRVH